MQDGVFCVLGSVYEGRAYDVHDETEENVNENGVGVVRAMARTEGEAERISTAMIR